MPAHDAVLAGDSRTTIRLNYIWRQFMAGLLLDYLEQNFWHLTQADFDMLQDVYVDMLEDLYT